MAIDTIKIFPSIGVARLGNSPDEFFIGPEIPGNHTSPSSGYKDSSCRIKRQAARFHIFGYEGGVLKQEITTANAEIKWTAELANTKADWKKFGGVKNPNLERRNQDVSDRASLRVTPGPRTLNGPNEKSSFDTGTFLGLPIPLGEIQTDEECRLLVLGGFGNSGSPHNSPIGGFADNDDWFDDVSDGPVRASVRVDGSGDWIEATSAWVVCGPPKFAPAIENMITLYDTLLQVAVNKLGAVSLLPSEPLSFTKDIYPLLTRAMNLKWVSKVAAGMYDRLQSIFPPPGQAEERDAIFKRLRNPDTDPHRQIDKQDMPKIWSDFYPEKDPENNLPITQALTKIQYHILQQWKDGLFNNDWTGSPVVETEITPEGLTRAALETCVGGPFYPGIETSFMTRDSYPFIEPFRLDATIVDPSTGNRLSPGDLTKQMALPWQADFYECRFDDGIQWWPAQRPEQVFTSSGNRQRWTRDIINNKQGMVLNWHKLGFLVRQGEEYIETERCE
jgi:hypothetical protein